MIWIEDRDYKFKPHRGFHGLFTEDGKVYEIQSDLIPMVADIPLGIGSGGTDCETLCRIGFTGKEAVAAVSKWNVTVGGKIDVVKV